MYFNNLIEEMALRDKLWLAIGAKSGIDKMEFEACLDSLFLQINYLNPTKSFKEIRERCEERGMLGEIVEAIWLTIFQKALDLAEGRFKSGLKLTITSTLILLILIIQPYLNMLPHWLHSIWFKVFSGAAILLGIVRIIGGREESTRLKEEMKKSYFSEIMMNKRTDSFLTELHKQGFRR